MNLIVNLVNNKKLNTILRVVVVMCNNAFLGAVVIMPHSCASNHYTVS